MMPIWKCKSCAVAVAEAESVTVTEAVTVTETVIRDRVGIVLVKLI